MTTKKQSEPIEGTAQTETDKYRDMVLAHYEKDEVIDSKTFKGLLDKLITAARAKR